MQISNLLLLFLQSKKTSIISISRDRVEGLYYLPLSLFLQRFFKQKGIFREYSATPKPLPCNGYRAKVGVPSARFFTENISKPLHLTNYPLYMRTEMSRASPIFLRFIKVIDAVFGPFPHFCPQLPFERGCGVSPI